MNIDTNILLSLAIGLISWFGRSKLNRIEADIKEIKTIYQVDHDQLIKVEGKVEALEKSHEECLKDRDKIHSRVSKYKGRP